MDPDPYDMPSLAARFRLERRIINDSDESFVTQVGVPSESKEGFLELLQTVRLRYPEDREKANNAVTQHWRELISLEARPEEQIQRFLTENNQRVVDFASNILPEGEADQRVQEQIRNRITSRFVFYGVYDLTTPLAELFEKSMQNEHVINQNRSKYKKFPLPRLGNVDFTLKHQIIRDTCYPYKSELSNNPETYQDDYTSVIHAIHPLEKDQNGRDLVMGYIIVRENRIIDLSIDPKWIGLGIASALIFTAAQQVADKKRGERDRFLLLFVRFWNLPAISLFQKHGFVVVERIFPPFCDWHGGFLMAAELYNLMYMAGALPSQRNPLVQCLICDAWTKPDLIEAHYLECSRTKFKGNESESEDGSSHDSDSQCEDDEN